MIYRLHFILLAFILIWVNNSHALLCKKLFQTKQEVAEHQASVKDIKEMIKYFDGYHEKFTNHKLTKETVESKLAPIERMSKQVIMDNLASLLIKYPNISNIRAKDIELFSWAENESNYFNFGFRVKNHLIQTRSNGYVTFLDMSWQYRDKQSIRHYKMAYMKEGQIHTENQTNFLLSTLPEKLHLSRNLSEQEQENWVKGKGYRGWKFGHKVHFSPHYFRFKNSEPYLIEFTRDELISHRADNLFEINTYDAIIFGYAGQKQRSNIIIPTKMNLEIEIVYVGEDASKTLSPKMKSAVSQGVLDFQIRD